MSQRFSPGLLLALLVLIGLLAFSGLMVVLKHPAPPTDDDDEGGPPASANAVQGRRFDSSFGSLAGLVPQGGSAPVISNPAAAAPADSAAGPAPAAADVPQAVAGDPSVVHGEQFRDLNWVKSQGGAYTLQVLGARSEDAVRQFIATQKDRTQFRYLQVLEAGQPWFVVVYGSFDTREQALAAADTLDGLSSRPFARPFSAYVSGPVQTPAAAVPAAPAADAPAPDTTP
jgi:septal ring-binding cell division protein DamX